MAEYKIDFTPEEEAWIETQVASGAYPDPAAVVAAGIELLIALGVDFTPPDFSGAGGGEGNKTRGDAG